MDKWIKENKITTVIIIVLVVVLGIFYFQKRSQKTEIQETPPTTSNIDLQAKCATQTEKALSIFAKDYSPSQYNSFAQENHYNQKMGKCFVLISYSPVYPPNTTFNTNSPFTQPTNDEDLVDAYENTDLAHCTIFGNDITTKDAKVNQACWTADGGNTYQDYKNFVLPRMEMPDPDKSQ